MYKAELIVKCIQHGNNNNAFTAKQDRATLRSGLSGFAGLAYTKRAGLMTNVIKLRTLAYRTLAAQSKTARESC
jgi:hypothetical protein